MTDNTARVVTLGNIRQNLFSFAPIILESTTRATLISQCFLSASKGLDNSVLCQLYSGLQRMVTRCYSTRRSGIFALCGEKKNKTTCLLISLMNARKRLESLRNDRKFPRNGHGFKYKNSDVMYRSRGFAQGRLRFRVTDTLQTVS